MCARRLAPLTHKDSKALTAERRSELLGALLTHADAIGARLAVGQLTTGWGVRVLSPQDISAGMLRRRPHNLNAQSSDATVHLIQGVLESGIDLVHIYVDTVGEPGAYARLLQSHFPRHPHIKWTVTRKADAMYPIVGAASIAAKVTRDLCLGAWAYEEPGVARALVKRVDAQVHDAVVAAKRKRAGDDAGDNAPGADGKPAAGHDAGYDADEWEKGSGYPGDARTVRYLEETLDPVFGWPGIVRFSWATAKTMLEEKRSAARGEGESHAPLGTVRPSNTRAYPVRWIDEDVTITDFFKTKSKPVPKPAPRAAAPTLAAAVLEQDRRDLSEHCPTLWRDLGLTPTGPADLFL